MKAQSRPVKEINYFWGLSRDQILSKWIVNLLLENLFTLSLCLGRGLFQSRRKMTAADGWYFNTTSEDGWGEWHEVEVGHDQWRIQGGQSGHGPPSKLAMEFGPLGGRKNNESSVNFLKFKVIFDPLSMLAMGFGPLWKTKK